MLRMSKLTDYGIVLMSYLAVNRQFQHSAHVLADAVQVPLPTVRKVLKGLLAGGLLNSERGAQGGYSLSRDPQTLNEVRPIQFYPSLPRATQVTLQDGGHHD